MIIELPTGIAVEVQLFALSISRLELIPVGVVHSWLVTTLFDFLIKSITQERREVEVVVGKPLLLIVPDFYTFLLHCVYYVYSEYTLMFG